jgi:hypothetical protein
VRYKLPKQGSEVEIEARVHWNEKDRMLKLSLPFVDPGAVVTGAGSLWRGRTDFQWQ